MNSSAAEEGGQSTTERDKFLPISPWADDFFLFLFVLSFLAFNRLSVFGFKQFIILPFDWSPRAISESEIPITSFIKSGPTLSTIWNTITSTESPVSLSSLKSQSSVDKRPKWKEFNGCDWSGRHGPRGEKKEKKFVEQWKEKTEKKEGLLRKMTRATRGNHLGEGERVADYFIDGLAPLSISLLGLRVSHFPLWYCSSFLSRD